jgi:hypothetical protein
VSDRHASRRAGADAVAERGGAAERGVRLPAATAGGRGDAARDKWNGILQVFNESAADLSMNRFLLHSWLSRHDYVGEKGLFKAVRSHARGSAAAATYLAELVADAELYRTAQEPAYRKWARG